MATPPSPSYPTAKVNYTPARIFYTLRKARTFYTLRNIVNFLGCYCTNLVYTVIDIIAPHRVAIISMVQYTRWNCSNLDTLVGKVLLQLNVLICFRGVKLGQL